MPVSKRHGLATAATATAVVSAVFAVYYIFAPFHVVETAVIRYSDFDRPVRHAMAIVPAGLVRQRGMLFAADALIVQLAPEVKPPQQGVMAFSWALRLVMGAAQAYYNMTVRRQMWSPWPGIAEVLAMASLALMWIQATYKASSQQRRAATAALLDSADAPHSKTGSSSSTSGRSPQQPAVLEHGGVPKPIAAVLMVGALLSCFGLGMMLTPEKFTDGLVTDDFYHQQPAISSLVDALPGDSRALLLTRIKSIHLRVCRALAELVGLQLLTEALQLLLLPRVLPSVAGVLRLLRACAVRAALSTAVFAYNYRVAGVAPACHVNTAMSACFFAVYAGLYLAYRDRPAAASGSDQGSKVD